MKMKSARTLLAGDTVNLPNIGWRTLTHVRKSRRYTNCMQIQWQFEAGKSSQAEPRCADLLEVK